MSQSIYYCDEGVRIIIDLVKSFRPQQWIKNLAVVAPVFFSGQILNHNLWGSLIAAFIILCLASSGSYLINDILDKEKDRLHPLKATRPIASGKISKKVAFITSKILILGSVLWSLHFRPFFTLVLISFLVIQLFYSLLLKRLIIFDVMSIAATFSLRVFAGAFILNVPVSVWLVVTIIMLALLLAIGKRRAEITLLSYQVAVKHREVVGHYPNVLLDGMTFMMATATVVTYTLFTFNVPLASTRTRVVEILPQTLSSPKWLMITVPFVLYGVFRYLYVIYEKKGGHSPERVLITDLPLLGAVIGWVIVAYFAVYIVVG